MTNSKAAAIGADHQAMADRPSLRGAPMRIATIGALLALWLAAGLAGHANAGQPQRKRLPAGHSSTHAPKARYHKPASAAADTSYYEHVLEKVPFGSKRWWDIYEEQHGTPD
jgi:hypothetical protein